jgi:hypothetical protein
MFRQRHLAELAFRPFIAKMSGLILAIKPKSLRLEDRADF